MVALPQVQEKTLGESHGCGSNCGSGLEKIYPTTAVRFGAMSWIGEFSYKSGTTFRCGAKVVIATDRGVEIGQQVSLSCNGCSKQVTREQILSYVKHSGPEFYKLSAGRILREATPADVNEHDHLNGHVGDDIDLCALLSAQLQLPLKIVTCEHLLGGERIVFYFRSDERVDFRDLVRELAHHYHTRIEMRQVGARDEARLVADYEVCGRECCCKNFLKKLRPVNMKMAKVQKSTLDPSKVSGRCGRLRCCLRYEHEGYEALLAKLPRVNTRVATEFGHATVIDRQILTQLVLVRLDDEREVTVPLEEITEFNLPPAPPRPPAPAGREGPPPRGEMRRPGARGPMPRSDAPRDRGGAEGGPPPRPAEGERGPRPRGPVSRGPQQPGDVQSEMAAPPPADRPASPADAPPGEGAEQQAAGRRRRRRRRRGGPRPEDGGARPPELPRDESNGPSGAPSEGNE